MAVVLYLGMADDIMSPLNLIDDIKILYVIDDFDPAYSMDESWEGLKKEIKLILKHGSDINNYTSQLYRDDESSDDVHYLKSGKAKIKEEKEQDNVWQMTFIYANTETQLIYYNKRDFYEKWPEEIQTVDYLIGIGALGFDYFPSFNKMKLFYEMLESRMRDVFRIYVLYFNHKYFENKIVLKRGRERKGTKLAHIKVDKDLNRTKNDKNIAEWFIKLLSENVTFEDEA